MRKKLDDLDKSACVKVEEALEIEGSIDSSFAQHVVADLAWEQLIAFYESKFMYRDQRRLLELRRIFHENAYNGLSGAHAWTLEAYADALQISDDRPRDAVRVGSKDSKSPAKVEPEAAAQHYKNALAILTLMFGKEHEYVAPLEKKREKLVADIAAGKKA